MAENKNRAETILADLINENILDYCELDSRKDMSSDEINGGYNAVVDDEGCLTLDTDIVGDLSDLVYRAHKNHVYGFVAEYLEG